MKDSILSHLKAIGAETLPKKTVELIQKELEADADALVKKKLTRKYVADALMRTLADPVPA